MILVTLEGVLGCWCLNLTFGSSGRQIEGGKKEGG